MTTAAAEGTQQPEIYCVKCKAKTVSRDIEQVTMKNGRPPPGPGAPSVAQGSTASGVSDGTPQI